jgi:hypothetical protein
MKGGVQTTDTSPTPDMPGNETKGNYKRDGSTVGRLLNETPGSPPPRVQTSRANTPRVGSKSREPCTAASTSQQSLCKRNNQQQVAYTHANKEENQSRRPQAIVKSRQQTAGPPTEAGKMSPTTIRRDETAHAIPQNTSTSEQTRRDNTTQPQATTPTPTQLTDNAAQAGTPGMSQTAAHHTTTPRQKDPL